MPFLPHNRTDQYQNSNANTLYLRFVLLLITRLMQRRTLITPRVLLATAGVVLAVAATTVPRWLPPPAAKPALQEFHCIF
jgi:hypothetical protein